MPQAKDKTDIANDKRQWFVRMSNGSTFGPINTKGLSFWAQEGRIMPDDEISEDRKTWIAAQTLDELMMDTMIERPDGSFAGPFNRQAIKPLAEEGSIPPNARAFHKDDLTTELEMRQITLFESDDPAPRESSPRKPNARKEAQPAAQSETLADGEREELTARISQLEELLEEVRVQAGDSAAELEREVENLRLALDKATAERDSLEEAAAAREADASELARLRKALEEAKSGREADASELARLRKALEEAKSGREADASELARLRKALEEDKAGREADASELARLRKALEEDKAGREADASELARLRKALAEIRQEYSELLEFSNSRDAEYAKSLAELQESQEQPPEPDEAGASMPVEPKGDDVSAAPDSLGDADTKDGRPPVDQRRIQLLEHQIVALRKDLEDANQRLQEAEVAAEQAQRPQEPEIAQIEAFGESALLTLQAHSDQERALSEQAQAASLARQEALRAQIEQLRRALRLAPGEATRAQQLEQRNDKLIAKLRQELDAARRQHQSELHQSSEELREAGQRVAAMEKRESALREQLSQAESRISNFDATVAQLRRRENALIEAEREFQTARQQWQAVETALMGRVEELESAASQLLIEPEQVTADAAPGLFGKKSRR